MIKKEIIHYFLAVPDVVWDPRGLVPVSYYTLKQWNFYLWGNDFLKSHPRIIIGIDFAM